MILNRDALTIWDGQDENAPKLVKKAGYGFPEPFTSSTGNLLLRFTSGSRGNGDGYRIRVDLSRIFRTQKYTYNTCPENDRDD